MRVLLAFDKFKDSLTARAACLITAETLRARHPDWTLDLCPLADGGEGFCEILTTAVGGEIVAVPVSAPRGGTVDASFGLVPWEKIPTPARALLQKPSPSTTGVPPREPIIAVIEMATASGLALLSPEQRDPWHTTTLGTGELIRAAVARGATGIVLGVGGSATHDLGLGALSALGLRFLDAQQVAIFPPVPASWSSIVRIEGHLSSALPPIWIACDVTNPLVGPRGAAAVYGPQKGLRAADLASLDQASARLARLLCAQCGEPETLLDIAGAGAAGGIAFGLMTAARAQLLPGFDLVSGWLDIEKRLVAADVVITGEGRFDESSLQGKGPGAVAARALALGKPVHVFAGALRTENALLPPHLQLHRITPPGTPLERALRQAPTHLANTVAQVF